MSYSMHRLSTLKIKEYLSFFTFSTVSFLLVSGITVYKTNLSSEIFDKLKGVCLEDSSWRTCLHYNTKSLRFSPSISYLYVFWESDLRFNLILARAGTAKAPPVPTKRDVRFGIAPKFYIYVEDLNLLPSEEIKLKFCNLSISETLSFKGRLFIITSCTNRSS